MQKTLHLSTLFFIAILCFTSCNEETSNMPKPTNGHTVVRMDMEDGDKKLSRKKYFDLVHGGEEINWRAIETQNAFDLLDTKRRVALQNQGRTEKEWVAGGNIKGQWIERGSNNQAGNIHNTAYDADEDMIYCIGGGGPIFKGTRQDDQWQLINDDLRFSQGLLQIIRNGEGNKRLLAAINHIPHYSDDDGLTWKQATGIIGNGGHLYDEIITENQDIFFLHKPGYWSNISLYKSSSMGEKYTEIATFSTHDTRNISLTKNLHNDDIYLIEQINGSKSFLHQYNNELDQLELINDNVTKSFIDGRANLIAVDSSALQLFIYDGNNQYFTSQDTGSTWTLLSDLPSRPWSVGIFMAPSDPTKVIYGEVNAHRSSNQGQIWTLVNEWWEYYSNVEYKIHADIMCIDEYRTKEGEPFILIGNHGGISITYDYGKTNLNIGEKGLNVGQFYDVRSYPQLNSYIFGGTQDQGLQRGLIDEEPAPVDFDQMISGDYGHLQFTGTNQQHLWAVYPGGSISFYADPIFADYPDAGYEVNSNNETVWIPPTMTSANVEENIIYVAGGSTDQNSNGSYIIKLEYKQQQILSSQLPFDFSVSGGTIASMAISPINPDLWWVATTNGAVYKSVDGGQNFVNKQFGTPGSHYLYGSCLLPSKKDEDIIYISGNGYGNSSSVFRSVDGGDNWTPLANGIPETTTFKIVSNDDESMIFTASEAGPFVWIDSLSRWESLVGEHTPNQTYWSIEYLSETSTLRYSTYGRGIWDFNILSGEPSSTNEPDELSVKTYPNPSSDYIWVSGLTEHQYQFKVISAQGKQISISASPEQDSKGYKIDISSLPRGTYHLLIQNEQSRTSKTFVKI